MERLDKLLAGTGRWSRKQAKELIRSGRVTVNGVTASDGKYDPSALILVDCQPVSCEKYLYYMMNKPGGLLSATRDPRQQTVLDLLPPHLRRVGLFPAGRLDKDSEGLLLLTNDGDLAHRLLSPKKHVDKWYYVRVEGTLTPEDSAAFEAGMTLADGLTCLPAKLEPLEEPGTAMVCLREGKFHQVKRMLAARGKPVSYLKRMRLGPLVLDPALEPGQYRPLTDGEREALLL